ncbi:hypothetical protein CDG81_14590 [Actinopolyspora erythraea]|uniref:DUF397 domain-containing protein n=1 Tax=Actinopolyspora erythraea TaxID=414996 RepID=A0A223RZC1_9ACTN|nr:DUF397 domain-containing protein [Actinopolyspora erythraea]ASU81129.1 hypothetical protein CDG81_14590 [Actinopolyspora erythraea]
MRGLELAGVEWRRSSYSNHHGACVEVANLGSDVVVRDSKDAAGSVLVVDRRRWSEFLVGLSV